MRLGRLTCPALLLALSLSACGGDKSETVSVRCDGSMVLVGAKSVEVFTDPRTRTTQLSFPDPRNTDQTGTIPVDIGKRCSVAMTRNVGS